MNISKKTLSFSCSKKMKYLRTPPDIWNDLKNEFDFTCDMCASHSNHLVDKYYTIDFDKHYAEAIHVFGSQEAFYNLPEPIQHVLVNMCFNLGGTRLSKFRKMLTACWEHNWDEMARQMQDSRWFYQVGRRSEELQDIVLEQR